ncbi:MAG: hypothetical protein ACLR56_04690 [Oscillospiraceae bacterium]
MKRLIPAAILLAVVLISYFGSLKYINDCAKPTDWQINAKPNTSGRNAEEIERLKKLWDKRRKCFPFRIMPILIISNWSFHLLLYSSGKGGRNVLRPY